MSKVMRHVLYYLFSKNSDAQLTKCETLPFVLYIFPKTML